MTEGDILEYISLIRANRFSNSGKDFSLISLLADLNKGTCSLPVDLSFHYRLKGNTQGLLQNLVFRVVC